MISGLFSDNIPNKANYFSNHPRIFKLFIFLVNLGFRSYLILPKIHLLFNNRFVQNKQLLITVLFRRDFPGKILNLL